MVRECPNCASMLLFDVSTGKLICKMCGESYGVDEFSSDEMEAKKLKPDTVRDGLLCHIYACTQCGGEITVNDVEASTFCIYCGNPTVVFSRVTKQKKPEFILPFEIDRDEAIRIFTRKMKSGFFIPKEIKNFKLESLHGIYVPYYLTELTYTDSAIVKRNIKALLGTKKEAFDYAKKTGFARFKILSDSSGRLNNDSSVRLEPFDLTKLKPFDDDYLRGFYSDVADVETDQAETTAAKRAMDEFNEAVYKTMGPGIKSMLRHDPKYIITKGPVSVMLPVWFLTIRYNNKPYTVLLNGQTGKIVGGFPWSRKKFWATYAVIATAISALLAIFISQMITADYSELAKINAAKAVLYSTIFSGCAFLVGFESLRKVIYSIELSTATLIHKYANDRQEGL